MSNDKQEVLFGKVYLPVFLQKLASRGVEIKSEGDLQESLKIAALARMHQEKQPVEQPRSIIKEAAAKLEAMTVGNAGVAQSFLQDPEVTAALQS